MEAAGAVKHRVAEIERAALPRVRLTFGILGLERRDRRNERQREGRQQRLRGEPGQRANRTARGPRLTAPMIQVFTPAAAAAL